MLTQPQKKISKLATNYDELVQPTTPTAQIKVTNIFYKNMNTTEKVIINRGGARSSKSFSLMQKFVYRFLTEKQKKILILRKSLPSLKISLLPDFYNILDTFGVRHRIVEEKMHLNYIYKNSLIHFGSLDDVEKIKSSNWNYIWMEEATEFDYEDFLQLNLRLSTPTLDGKRNQIYLSLNPIDEQHWIKTKVLDVRKTDIIEIHSSYKDNPFLSEDYISELNRLAEQDANYHRVYCLGEWGKLENLIYPNFSIIEKMPDSGEKIYGLDFGFNNPSALVEIIIKDDEVFERQLLYKSGLTNTQLIAECEKLKVSKKLPLYADAAEPDRIEEFRKAGFKIKPAYKGRNSVKDGIDFIKQLTVNVTADSPDLIKEKRSYSWRTDKNGNCIDEPVKFNDHLLDGERMACFTHMKARREPKLRWIG